MASQKMFTSDLKQKCHSAFIALNALTQKENQRIISILQTRSNLNELTIANQMGLHYSSIQVHLESLNQAQLLEIKEDADQAFYSLNRHRLNKISRFVNNLTQ